MNKYVKNDEKSSIFQDTLIDAFAYKDCENVTKIYLFA